MGALEKPENREEGVGDQKPEQELEEANKELVGASQEGTELCHK